MTDAPDDVWMTKYDLRDPDGNMELETQYIRADIHNKLKKENTKLRKQVKSMSKIVNMSKAKPCN